MYRYENVGYTTKQPERERPEASLKESGFHGFKFPFGFSGGHEDGCSHDAVSFPDAEFDSNTATASYAIVKYP